MVSSGAGSPRNLTSLSSPSCEELSINEESVNEQFINNER
jgi:hypothetical protein